MSRKRGSDSDVPIEDEDPRRMALKYGMLKEEYHEVQRETRALKKRLQRARIKRDRLLQEVRFLRCRRKSFKTFDLAGIEEGTACQEMMLEHMPDARESNAEYDSAGTATASEEETLPEMTIRESSSASDFYCTPEIDARKSLTAMNFKVFSEPFKMAGSSFTKGKSLLETNGYATTLKFSYMKDGSSGLIPPEITGKRKISWQDELSLKL